MQIELVLAKDIKLYDVISWKIESSKTYIVTGIRRNPLKGNIRINFKNVEHLDCSNFDLFYKKI